MKLFNTLSALAVVKAQVPDFSDLNALFASLTNDLNEAAEVRNEDPIVPVQDNAAGARYLVATTTVTAPVGTTTPAPPVPTATGCWKCDAMSFTACATGGYFQTCSPDQTNGDNGVCFLELRETNQFLTQLCTGCKDRNSCYNLRRQNFVGSATGSLRGRQNDQCKPEWLLQRYNRRYGNQQSTCRTCFNMCDTNDTTDGNNCFGGLEVNQATAAAFFKYPAAGSSTGDMSTVTFSVAGSNAFNANARSAVDTQTNNLGIPLGIKSGVGATNVGYVQNSANMVVWGGYSGDTGHGKATTGRGGDKWDIGTGANIGRTDSVSDLYLFWAIQDQSKTWWEYDHIDLQTRYQSEGDEPADIQATDINGATGWNAANGLL